MYIHNNKKKIALSIFNLVVELAYLPFKLFSKPVNIHSYEPKKILLVRLDHIGDIVMTTPSFSLMRTRFPHAKIYLLANAGAKNLLNSDPRIDEIIVFNWPWSQPQKKGRFSWTKIKELIAVIFQIRKEKIDLFVDFRGDLRFILLFGFLTGIRIRVSNSRSGKSSLLKHVSDYDVEKHELERSADVLQCFISPNQGLRPSIFLEDEELISVKKLLEKETGQKLSSNLAIIAPYSSRDVKSWPIKYFQEVINHLEKRGFLVLLVGTSSDHEQAMNMISQYKKNVYSLTGKTTVRELAALVKQASIVVGVDTGVLHLASCFELPIIALFGSTRSVEFRPYSPMVTVLDSGVCTCNQFLHVICDNQIDGYSKCLSLLKPVSVILTIDEIFPLSENSKPSLRL
jgi:ADP-heptose:LPS heptosyltransferase